MSDELYVVLRSDCHPPYVLHRGTREIDEAHKEAAEMNARYPESLYEVRRVGEVVPVPEPREWVVVHENGGFTGAAAVTRTMAMKTLADVKESTRWAPGHAPKLRLARLVFEDPA